MRQVAIGVIIGAIILTALIFIFDLSGFKSLIAGTIVSLFVAIIFGEDKGYNAEKFALEWLFASLLVMSLATILVIIVGNLIR